MPARRSEGAYQVAETVGMVVGVVVIALQLWAVVEVAQGQVDRAQMRNDAYRMAAVACGPTHGQNGTGNACHTSPGLVPARSPAVVMDLVSGNRIAPDAPIIAAAYRP